MRLNQYEWDPEIDLIAEGAFAEVFKAKDINSQNRYVALKIYKEAVVRGTAASAGHKKYTLENEFQNVDGLSHSNIISYFGLDYITHTDAMGRSSKYAVLIMEYANAGTLQDFLKANPSKEIRDNIIRDVIQGIGYLHSEGVIHRDLKPGNILITKNRKGIPIAKITDFGISKDTLTEDTIQQSMTAGVGTPHYMAPEQIYKKRFGLHGEISARTDIWGIGVVIYRMLTGRLPFGNASKDYELVRDAITNDTPSFDGVPTKYKAMLESCFQKEAAKRPEKATDLLKFLDSGFSSSSEEVVNREIEDTVLEASLEDNLETVLSFKNEIKKEGETNTSKRTKKQKIGVLLFGLLNLVGVIFCSFIGYFPPVIITILIIYAIGVIIAVVCFMTALKIPEFAQLLLYGFLMFFAICTLFFPIFFFIEFFGLQTILSMVYVALFHVLFIGWLSFKELGINRVRKKYKSVAIVSVCFLIVYLISIFLPMYGSEANLYGIFYAVLTAKWLLLTLLPNILLITTFLAFYSNRHVNHLKKIILLGVLSILGASLWWLFLDEDQGYISSLAYEDGGFYRIYIQEYGLAYYFWLLSIIVSFGTVIYDAVKEQQANKKYYWPSILTAIVLLGSLFMYKYSKSEIGYNFDQGIKNMDHVQFKKALDAGADLKWNRTVMSTILGSYTESNSYQVEQMTESLFKKDWTAYDNELKLSLERAIETNNTKILKYLLNSKAKAFVNSTTSSGRPLISLAKDQENEKIASLLIAAGAKDIR